MAIDTKAKRNSALKDGVAVVFPTGAIDAAGRQTLVGDYLLSSVPPPPQTGTGGVIFADARPIG